LPSRAHDDLASSHWQNADAELQPRDAAKRHYLETRR
jgi:hypothetical protein